MYILRLLDFVSRWAVRVLFYILTLIVLLAIAVYLPPVQHWLKGYLTTMLSEQSGMDVSIGRVQLSFPLDLRLDQMKALSRGTEPDAQRGDTIVAAEALLLDVKLLPLFEGVIDLKGFELRQADVNTMSYVSDTHIEGHFNVLAIDKPAVCDLLATKQVDVNKVRFKDADFKVILSDTAAVDTMPSEPLEWKINVNKLDVQNTRAYIQMPGDSMRIQADVGQLMADSAFVDLAESVYRVKRGSISASDIAYDLPYIKPTKGFDTNHLAVGKLETEFTDFSYTADGIDLNLKQLALNEKSGLVVNALRGDIHYDSTRVDLSNGYLLTPHSRFDFMVHMPFAALDKYAVDRIQFRLNGQLGRGDVMLFARDALGDFAKSYPDKPLRINMAAEGTLDNVNISYCTISLPGNIDVQVSGSAFQISNALRRHGNLHYMVGINNIDFIKGFLPKDLTAAITIPRDLKLGGDLRFEGSRFALTKNTLYCGKGSLSFDGTFSASNLAYNGRLIARQFPLQAFLPRMGLSPLTADININGHGTDFLHAGTSAKLKANIHSFDYDGISLGGMLFTADLTGNKAVGTLHADNHWLHADLSFTAEQLRDEIRASAQGEIYDMALNMGIPSKADAEQPSVLDSMRLMTQFCVEGFSRSRPEAMGAKGDIYTLNLVTPTRGYPGSPMSFAVGTSDDSTHVMLQSGDMTALIKSTDHVNKLISGLADFATHFVEQLTSAQLNQDSLRQFLPNLDLHIEAGIANPLQQLANANGYLFDNLYADIHTNDADGVAADIDIVNFKTGALLLEHSGINIAQRDGGIKLNAQVQNTNKKNPNRFKATLDGEILSDGFSVLARFVDEHNREGLHFGTRATLDGQGGVSFKLIPEVSTIAFRKFKVNADNYVAVDSAGFISGNIDLLADDKTHLSLFSVANDNAKQDVTLSIQHLNLYDVSQVVPGMPMIEGLLSGDIHLIKSGDSFTAAGAIETNKLVYEGIQIGDFGSELFYIPDGDNHYLTAQIFSDGSEVATLEGSYLDQQGGVLDATLSLTKLPCTMLNPFLGDGEVLALKGMLDGEIQVSGSTDELQLSGKLTPDSIHAYSELYGLDLRMENKDILIDNNKILFHNIGFYSTNSNPLTVNGSVDLGDFSNMVIDFAIKANNFELINTHKTKTSLLYGKVYVDVDATLSSLKSNSSLLILKGNVGVLGNTNVTYVMKDSPLQAEDQFEGLVEFEDFNNPEAEDDDEPSSTSGIYMDLGIDVNRAAHLHCELSDDGKSYVDCFGGGNIATRIFPSGDMTVTGRFDIASGEMKYMLPFIPLRTFKFTGTNYILFTGDVANPTLNITAVETTKASVTNEGGASRMVQFNVGVAITKQLSNMGLEFIIDAPEDLEVQNELAVMNAETKSRTAISMLATGLYLSQTNKTGFKANNALNAFLENEIQNIAGKALQTIDISVGVEGNTSASGNTQTDYSFQFSKKLWGDRVTFVLGGKVTTGTMDDNQSQSFIDNVSIEYRLDNDNTRYIRVFYDNDTRDPLEGSYSSAGAGYVWRRKTDNLGDLFIFKRKK